MGGQGAEGARGGGGEGAGRSKRRRNRLWLVLLLIPLRQNQLQLFSIEIFSLSYPNCFVSLSVFFHLNIFHINVLK